MPISADVLSSLRSLAPEGKLEGREYRMINPNRPDKSFGSFSINIDSLLWSDFACGASGKGLASLASYINGTEWKVEAEKYGELSGENEARVSGSAVAKKSATQKVYERIIEFDERIADGATVELYYPKTESFGKVKIEMAHHYILNGKCRRIVLRWKKDKKKTFTPIIRARIDGKEVWYAAGEDGDKYLYNVDMIAQKNVVVFVAGEKKCDMLQAMFPELAVVSWSNGDKSLKDHVVPDLNGKRVILWPDNDASSIDSLRAYAAMLVAKYPNKRVEMIKVDSLPEHGDCGSMIEGGAARGDIEQFLSANRYYYNQADPTNTEQKSIITSSPWNWVVEKSDEWVRTNPRNIVMGPHHISIDTKSISNAYMVLCNYWDERTKSRVGDYINYNLFEDKIFIVKCPPWEDEENFEPRELVREIDGAKMRMWLERIGFRIGVYDLDALISMIAVKNVINPPKDYFESLKWDGVHRLNNWLTYYCGCEKEPLDYLAAIGSKFLIGAVSRIYQPGSKFDTMLVLEGPQGAGKSEALRTLATFGDKEYFTDENIKFGDKDALMIAQGKIIIELAEAVSLRRAESNESKSFISRRTDRYRPPYARGIVERKRMFVLAATHNPDGNGLFTDTTGNRRYWPATVGKRIDVAALAEAREQLWAEAVHRYKLGEKVYLDEEESKQAIEQQAMRVRYDEASEDIEKYIAEWARRKGRLEDGFGITELLDIMEIPFDRRSNSLLGRFKQNLQTMGYEEFREQDPSGKRRRVWRKREWSR